MAVTKYVRADTNRSFLLKAILNIKSVTFTLEQVVVAAWQRYPDKFGLKGYELSLIHI